VQFGPLVLWSSGLALSVKNARAHRRFAAPNAVRKHRIASGFSDAAANPAREAEDKPIGQTGGFGIRRRRRRRQNRKESEQDGDKRSDHHRGPPTTKAVVRSRTANERDAK